MTLPSLRLKANAERRLRAGHLWVYSNEVDVAATPLNAFAAGDQAVLEMANGKPLGIVALSPNNLICGRLISRDTKHVLDKSYSRADRRRCSERRNRPRRAARRSVPACSRYRSWQPSAG